jgi:L-threonylcarbamoyladenylate synthase
MALTDADAAAFENAVGGGGVVLFGADTVYGLACDPANASAVARMYTLKGRAPDKPAAVMAFSPEVLRGLLTECGPRTREAAQRLLPGAVTLLVPGLGVRFPELPGELAALAGMSVPVLQTSANPAGGAEAHTLEAVEADIVTGVDLVLDCGTLKGTASTVVDLRDFESSGLWGIVRHGAVSEQDISAKLAPCA